MPDESRRVSSQLWQTEDGLKCSVWIGWTPSGFTFEGRLRRRMGRHHFFPWESKPVHEFRTKKEILEFVGHHLPLWDLSKRDLRRLQRDIERWKTPG